MRIRPALAIVAILVGAACGGGTPSPLDAPASVTPSPSPAVADGSPTVAASATPSATATARPTGAPSPSPSLGATESPTAEPSPSGGSTSTPGPASTPVPQATATPAPTATPAYPLAATVEMSGSLKYFFRPDRVDVAAGGAVTFVWISGTHNVVSTGSPRFADHPEIMTSGSFSATFTAPGTYTFTCQVHPDTMNGSITVH